MQLSLFAPTERRDWTCSEMAFVRKHYTHGWLTSEEVALLLHRSHGSVRQFIHRNPHLRKHKGVEPQPT